MEGKRGLKCALLPCMSRIAFDAPPLTSIPVSEPMRICSGASFFSASAPGQPSCTKLSISKECAASTASRVERIRFERLRHTESAIRIFEEITILVLFTALATCSFVNIVFRLSFLSRLTRNALLSLERNRDSILFSARRERLSLTQTASAIEATAE